jgi:glutamine synthetase type III
MVLPKLPRDAGDRNRTSPFAFTGNKFEFRAVSSNQSIAYPNIALNMAVTESLDYMATELEALIKGGRSLEQAVAELLPMVLMANRYILPAAFRYQKELGESVVAVNAAGGESTEGKKALDGLSSLINAFKQRTDALAAALGHEGNGSAETHARHFRDVVVPAMASLRETGDSLELVIPHDLWPLATYREMLFVK